MSESNHVDAVLARFERWLIAYRKAKGRNVRPNGDDPLADKRDLLFLEWLNRQSDLTPDDRDAVRASYDEREAAAEAQREAEERALEEERRAMQREAAEAKRQQDEYAARLRADQERERAEREAARRAEERRQLEAQRAEERRQLQARLADPAWRRGEDPGALRHVAAWLTIQRKDGRITLALTEEDRRTLNGAVDLIMQEVKTRQDEIAIAKRLHREEGLLRQARGELPVEVPAPITFEQLAATADPDAVARWLVAHARALTYVGYAWREKDGDDVQEGATRPREWPAIAERCARWSTWARLDAETANVPDDTTAPALRALGLDVLQTGQATGAVADVLADERQRWDYWPARPENQKAEAEDNERRTTAHSRRRAPIAEPDLRDAILAFVKRFQKEHRRGPSKREILDGVSGQTRRVSDMIDALAGEDELARTVVKGRPAYEIASL